MYLNLGLENLTGPVPHVIMDHGVCLLKSQRSALIQGPRPMYNQIKGLRQSNLDNPVEAEAT